MAIEDREEFFLEAKITQLWLVRVVQLWLVVGGYCVEIMVVGRGYSTKLGSCSAYVVELWSIFEGVLKLALQLEFPT